MNLIYVKTIYNEKIRIDKEDLDNPKKILIPIYNKNGVKIMDQKSYNPKRDLGKCYLHKSNIES